MERHSIWDEQMPAWKKRDQLPHTFRSNQIRKACLQEKKPLPATVTKINTPNDSKGEYAEVIGSEFNQTMVVTSEVTALYCQDSLIWWNFEGLLNIKARRILAGML